MTTFNKLQVNFIWTVMRKRAFYLSQNLTFSQLLFGRVSKRIFKTPIWEFFVGILTPMFALANGTTVQIKF